MIKCKSASTVEIAVSSPSLKKIGKTATRSVKSRGDVKSLKIIGKAVGARNVYTGKKVTLPGLKRSAILGHEANETWVQQPDCPSAPTHGGKCSVEGCGAGACYGYPNSEPNKCFFHRLEGMVTMVWKLEIGKNLSKNVLVLDVRGNTSHLKVCVASNCKIIINKHPNCKLACVIVIACLVIIYRTELPRDCKTAVQFKTRMHYIRMNWNGRIL